jgi:hypothetical protein
VTEIIEQREFRTVPNGLTRQTVQWYEYETMKIHSTYRKTRTGHKSLGDALPFCDGARPYRHVKWTTYVYAHGVALIDIYQEPECRCEMAKKVAQQAVGTGW